MNTTPAAAATLATLFALSACAVSAHPASPSELGVPRRSSELIAQLEQPGPIEVESVASCDWAVPRSGLINLEHEKARAAALEDVEEPIQVYFHVLRHPSRGTFIIDTGVERALRDDPENALMSGLVAKVMHTDRMKIHVPLADWLAKETQPLAGVLLTHLHLDHIAGMRDVPKGTPIHLGPGETRSRSFTNAFVQGVTDRALEGHAALEEWAYQPDADGRFEGVVDVFGDGSLWALWVPGHTAGSTAYLARTPRGPVLFTGDASHTAWGWAHDVEPGTFSSDRPKSAESLARLRRLVAEHPSIETRLGHQDPHAIGAASNTPLEAAAGRRGG